ncbi:SDR family oxidoreductase, partial [Arthrobacter sp.]|uniref:SDR family NAD(P)-dependent oxidoreductase n=1 Tax=Arthrobacter sp. TaxID=1667 RepID=UPI00339B4003
LISGGTSGVGLAAARAFAETGVRRIVLAGRDPHRGAAAAELIQADGVECTFLPTDAADSAAAVATAAGALDALDSIDILVNTTAPRMKPVLFGDMDARDIPAMLTQNALPAMNMAHAVLPYMRHQGRGVILNVASDAAKTATPGESVIGAAMAAIVMFTRTIALEEKRHGIRANVLTPSLISGTGLTSHLLDDGFSGKLFAAAAKRAALGVPDAGDIAALIVFLASPAARRLTGQAISVNGGISAS